jgi:CRP-like cAMP-binding protein
MILEPKLTIKHYSKNDFFIQFGQIEKQIGYIITGSFKWFYTTEKGKNINFHFFFENEFVVEYQSFITQKPSKMNIQAMEDSIVVLLPKREQILNIYAQSHNWAQFGRVIAETVYTLASDRLYELLLHNAEDRYKNLLKTYPNIFQRLTLSDISSYIGIQGPSLSRIRKKIFKS